MATTTAVDSMYDILGSIEGVDEKVIRWNLTKEE